jgi:hypothetical protein
MPLLDHFHPPLSDRRHWYAFHNSWATYISSQLNAMLPEGYFAEANVQFGVEIDVAAFEDRLATPPEGAWNPATGQFPAGAASSSGGLGRSRPAWAGRVC